MILLSKLYKTFKTEEVETHALQNVLLNVKSGEFVSIMGPSGCGKTTLLNIIGLLDQPSQGQYLFNDIDIRKLKQKELAILRQENFGFIFQNFNLIHELSVAENIELPLLYLKVSKEERKARVDEMLQRLRLKQRADYFPNQLSGGQQQRVAIGRALISQPKVILADEPTGNLDSANRNIIMNLLTEINETGTTVILVTHSMHDASFSDRIIHLHDGSITTQANSEVFQPAAF